MSNRRTFLKTGGAAAALAVGGVRVEAAPEFDVLLKGGTVVDGTGAPAFKADVALRGDTIAAVGDIPAEHAARVVDANGLHVVPGFVDIHSHSDGDILAYPGAESRVRQGVTTEVTGNCGHSAAPLAGHDVEARRQQYREEGVRSEWTDVASYFQTVEKSGLALNHAFLVGQGTIRQNASGLVDRPLNPDEMKAVLRAVEEAMDHGAVGLSTGLEYTPGMYTPTEEIVAMARVVARYGGVYTTHSRNEEAMLLEAVNEAVGIGRQSGARVEISHLKAAGRVNWDKQRAALDLIEAGRASGVDVLADAYPYTAYSTGLDVLFEAWVREGGDEAILKRLRDPETRARIRKETARRVPLEPGGYDLIVISSVKSEQNRPVVGRNILQIAEQWKVEPVDAILRLVEEEKASVSYVGHGMSDENVDLILRHPLVMVGSDGSSMAPVGRAAETRPHPRSYGCYGRVLGHYVRERKLLDLPTAVRKMTSMPADQAGLRDRGRVGRGQKADLVAFDAATVKDVATFEDPHRYATGFRHVLVNGVAVVQGGQQTSARPGRVLRRA